MSNIEVNEIKELIGKVFKEVKQVDYEKLQFIGEEGCYEFYHNQDCCESVIIDDIVGDLSDLEGSPILMAEETIHYDSEEFEPKDENYYLDDSNTWTFYKFKTIKGYVTVKWWGSSNGYYSETVNFRDMKF